MHGNGAPWIVSETSLLEFERITGPKGEALRAWWWEWAAYRDSCFEAGSYPEVDFDSLMIRSAGPQVSENQLSLPIEPPSWPLAESCVPPFEAFQDAGDRALIGDALRAGILGILTTDVRTFWRPRRALRALGLQVFARGGLPED